MRQPNDTEIYPCIEKTIFIPSGGAVEIVKFAPKCEEGSYERVAARNSGHAKRRLTENNAIRWYRTRDCKTTTNRERERERGTSRRNYIDPLRFARSGGEVRSIIENNGTGRSIFVSIFPPSLSLFPRIEKCTKMLLRRAYLPQRHEINGAENSSWELRNRYDTRRVFAFVDSSLCCSPLLIA